MSHSLAYRNITISGLPGSGSTTLLKLLKTELPDWQGFSGGDFMRAYALEHGSFEQQKGIHHDSSHYSDEYDRLIDMDMRSKLTTEEHWIIESWLSGFLAQGVEGVLKVLVYCSHDDIRVDRIVNRDKVTVEEAIANIKRRTDNNVTKWSRMYKSQWDEWVVGAGKVSADEPIDFWRQDLYDICIDTYSTNREQTLERVLEALHTQTK